MEKKKARMSIISVYKANSIPVLPVTPLSSRAIKPAIIQGSGESPLIGLDVNNRRKVALSGSYQGILQIRRSLYPEPHTAA